MRMPNFALGLACAAFAATGLLPRISAQGPPDVEARAAEAYAAAGEFLVGFEPGRAEDAIAECKKRGLEVLEVYAAGNILRCTWPKDKKAQEVRAEVLKEKAIKYVVPNATITLDPLPKPPAAPAAAGAAAAEVAAAPGGTSSAYHSSRCVPNDQFFGKLWGMKSINADKAWCCTRESTLVVAVLDTGIDYNHEDLAGNMWKNPYEVPNDGLDNDGNGVVDDVFGFNAFTAGGDPLDKHGHGSHCAGTIGAVGNNSVGVAGVNWKVRLMGVKVLSDSGSGTTLSLVKGIDYAWRNGAKVLSASLGYPPGTPRSFLTPIREALLRAEVAGTVFVAAAGNNFRNNNDALPVYPASFCDPNDPDGAVGNMISVAAINIGEQPSNFTNVGKRSVHLAAPGGQVKGFTDETDILSTVSAINVFGANVKKEGGGKYAYLPGTSMATPHVSGAIALTWARPEYAKLSGREVKGLVLSKGRRVDALKGLCATEAILDLSFLCPQGECPPIPCPPIFCPPVYCPPVYGPPVRFTIRP